MQRYLFSWLLLFSSSGLKAEDWQLESERDGIKVFSRQEANSNVVSFRGEATIPYSTDQVYKVLSNPDQYHRWMPLVKDSRVLDAPSPNLKTVFVHIGIPWPVRDRYFINRGELRDLENGGKFLEIKSVDSDFRDETKVQGWTTRSYFMLRPTQDPNRTYLEIELNQDPRGKIPKWMVNFVQSSWPRLFFVNLNAYLENPKAKTND